MRPLPHHILSTDVRLLLFTRVRRWFPLLCLSPTTLLIDVLQEVTSQEESFMLDISGYIRERVNQNHAFSRTSLEDCTA